MSQIETIKQTLQTYQQELPKLRQLFMQDGVIDAQEKAQLEEIEGRIQKLQSQLGQASAGASDALTKAAGLSGSVGYKGENQKADVIKVQELLNKKGGKLKEDGKCGPATIYAIRDFQKTNFGGADARVDPDGRSWKALTGSGKNFTPSAPPAKEQVQNFSKAESTVDTKAKDTSPSAIGNLVSKENLEKGARFALQQFISQGNVDIEVFNVSKDIPLAEYLIFSLHLTMGVQMNLTLEHTLVEKELAIESKASGIIDAYFGVKGSAIGIMGYNMLDVTAALHGALDANGTAKLAIKKDTVLEGSLRAEMVLKAYADFNVKILAESITLYTTKTSDFNFFIMTAPTYAISFQVNSWTYKGARRVGGEFAAEMHPDFRNFLQKTKEVLTSPMTYLKKGAAAAAHLAEEVWDGVEYVAGEVGEAAEWALDTAADAVAYMNPYYWFAED
ncbi:peptidoglycan-binding protein [Saprospira sp. CCB-QB6]|uniref:peptidoglycan-binding domain-containing protein n=1 Tax=Saprospira sp. CCB-QB6 TaxID=3023936 RepID=UPI00234BD9C5|nr:peptidoglycan-binding protein [Saprospira sp. CCB-QB6]WCL82871.1 peptidoglycan-binding protein [Saprospira sp. CCB-QB6]